MIKLDFEFGSDTCEQRDSWLDFSVDEFQLGALTGFQTCNVCANDFSQALPTYICCLGNRRDIVEFFIDVKT